MNSRSKFNNSMRNNHHKERNDSELIFSCLNGKDVIASKISDHHPTIHNNTLFWNIMMQGRMRTDGNKISYNNGFALIESDRAYQHRLKKIAHVVAEIIAEHPSIDVISICEGPIKTTDIAIFNRSLYRYQHMRRFVLNDMDTTYHAAAVFPKWGLMLYTNHFYQAQLIDHFTPLYLSNPTKLANRVQVWRISSIHLERIVILAHLPFSNDTHISTYDNLSSLGKVYCHLFNEFLNQYSESDMTICADFNFNPNLIGSYLDRLEDKICPNNSILLTGPTSQNTFDIEPVTVDGILLSRQAKQKSYLSRSRDSLFYNFSREHQLLANYRQSQLIDHRAKDNETQQAYDERCGLVPYIRN